MHDLSKYGIGTLVNHVAEGDHSLHSHVMPIYQTSTFSFPDVDFGAEFFKGENDGYAYTRLGNPNADQLAEKYSYLEALDLIRANPDKKFEELAAARVYATGMAAITTGILSRVSAGETIITQGSLYGGTHAFFSKIAPRFGINVVWVGELDLDSWEKAFAQHPEAVLAYVESPANPTMDIVDLKAVSDIAHQYDAWSMVDNTFATPYNQRPLTLGYDIVAHSTTKYLTGHGLVVGGSLITTQLDFLASAGELSTITKTMGAAPSPFDNWLASIGLKTFELRMQRHNENAAIVAAWLNEHSKIESVYFPGLKSHPGHEIARRQMPGGFGGMISFELRGGFDAGVTLMKELNLITLAVSLGNVDSLIQHPASMTHSVVSSEERLRMGLSDGLVRFSVGIENVEDILSDLNQALDKI